MDRVITRRETLLECLEMMRMRFRVVSVDRKGIIPIEGQEDLFFERQRKCRIIQDLIQANESEPVRQALADWQIMLMEGRQPDTKDLKQRAKRKG